MEKRQLSTTSYGILDFLNVSKNNIDDFDIYYSPTIENVKDNSIFFLIDFNEPLLNVINKQFHHILYILPSDSSIKEIHNAIYVDDPKYTIALIINTFRCDRSDSYPLIHPTAIISPNARIANNVRIGAYSIIGDCSIGNGCIIKENVHIYDDVTIGNNVMIYSSSQIGSTDFGPVQKSDGSYIMFPQVGELIIEDNVEIFPLSVVGKGALGPTIIKKGCKIDHCCTIGHNSYIGENTIVTCNATILGSVKIGPNCYIGSSCIIKEKLEIGDHSTVGMGAVVTKSFPSEVVIAGNPATILSDMIERNKIINKIVDVYK